MKTTKYFDETVCRKRRYVSKQLCAAVMANPIAQAVQPDGRIRFWGEVRLQAGGEPRILRIVTLEDGETVHNAFLDRRFPRRRI